MTTYLAIEYDMGSSSQELTDFYNSYGAQGWQMSTTEVSRFNQRRVVFMQGAPTEYLVVDYDTGRPVEELTDLFNGYGVDGWDLSSVDLAKSNVRRAIFMKRPPDGGGGGIEEAPLDSNTYGRRNAVWNLALAKNNDELDGGSF
jgi:hypothetical protein